MDESILLIAKTIHQEDTDIYLASLGKNVMDYRKIVLKETCKQFARRIGVSEPTLRNIERGDPGVSIGIWFKVFALMQTAGSVVDAAKPEQILLASMMNQSNPPPGFEK